VIRRPWLHVAALTLAACALAPAAPRRPFDAGRAYRDLVRQCDFGPRVPGLASHNKCLEWLADQLRGQADAVRLQSFTAKPRGRPLHLTNIIATFNPGGSPHVLLCAHWDTRPTADRDPDPARRGTPIPGANDGASGVAVLLEIARALKAHPPRQRVTMVLFDGEDYGPGAEAMFLGSRFFAKEYRGPAVSWAVLLDMVGDRDLRLPPEALSLEQAPRVVGRLWGAAQREGCSAFVRGRGPAVMDDHVFLLRAGIPCIDVIDFDYPYWHTLADTPDKCSPASLEQVGRALLRALADDAAGPA
jgi:Zn-dependent M28 family amino/carboxypeptidase